MRRTLKGCDSSVSMATDVHKCKDHMAIYYKISHKKEVEKSIKTSSKFHVAAGIFRHMGNIWSKKKHWGSQNEYSYDAHQCHLYKSNTKHLLKILIS